MISCDQPAENWLVQGCLMRGTATLELKNGPAGFTWFWDAIFEIGSPTLKKLPSGFLMPAELVTVKIEPDPP